MADAPPFNIGDKVLCTYDTGYHCWKDSIYTVTSVTIGSNTRDYYIKVKEEYHACWHQAIFFTLYKTKINPKIIHYLKEYKDKGNINRIEWEELKALITEIEKC